MKFLAGLHKNPSPGLYWSLPFFTLKRVHFLHLITKRGSTRVGLQTARRPLSIILQSWENEKHMFKVGCHFKKQHYLINDPCMHGWDPFKNNKENKNKNKKKMRNLVDDIILKGRVKVSYNLSAKYNPRDLKSFLILLLINLLIFLNKIE